MKKTHYLQVQFFQWPQVSLCNTLPGGSDVSLWGKQSSQPHMYSLENNVHYDGLHAYANK